MTHAHRGMVGVPTPAAGPDIGRSKDSLHRGKWRLLDLCSHHESEPDEHRYDEPDEPGDADEALRLAAS